MTNHEPQRRALLRGLVAAGLAFCFPALWGCGRKETTSLEPSAPAESPPPAMPPPESSPAPAAAPAAPAAAAAKVSKQQVQYQEQPKGTQKCSNCQHFIAASNTCVLVEGTINPEGWCTIWAASQSAAPGTSPDPTRVP